MAVVIPFIAIVAGGAAVSTAVAAGVVTVAAIAGAASIVSGVAALAGNTKVAKIAGIIGLAAGAYSLVSGAASGASAAEGMGAGAAPGEASGAIEGTLAASRGNTAIADTAATIDSAGGPTIADNLTAPISDTAALEAAAYNGGAAPVQLGPQGSMAGTGAPQPTSLLNEVMRGAPGESLTSVTPEIGGTPVQQSFLDSFKNVGKVMRENKELVDLAGGALKNMYGGSSDNKMMSIYQQRLDLERQKQDRENANANNLVGLRLPLIYNPAAPPLRRPGQG